MIDKTKQYSERQAMPQRRHGDKVKAALAAQHGPGIRCKRHALATLSGAYMVLEYHQQGRAVRAA